MKNAVPILAALLALAGCGQSAPPARANDHRAEPPAAEAGRPIIRLPGVPGRPASGYFSLGITGDRGALLSASSPRAERIELHESTSERGMASMRPLGRLPVRDGETLDFAESGRHLMIFGLARELGAGARVPIVFHFERGADVTVEFAVVLPGGDI